MMSYPSHHDSRVYNTGTSDDPRPLDDFWADRFLVPRVATDHTQVLQPNRGQLLQPLPRDRHTNFH